MICILPFTVKPLDPTIVYWTNKTQAIDAFAQNNQWEILIPKEAVSHKITYSQTIRSNYRILKNKTQAIEAFAQNNRCEIFIPREAVSHEIVEVIEEEHELGKNQPLNLLTTSMNL